MCPLDFEKFCWAMGLGIEAWDEALSAFLERRPVFVPVHERLLQLFHWYLYENVVAQELHTHGDVWFFRNRKAGEVDFVIERNEGVVPIEVKSGKSYKRHSALNNILRTPNYGIEQAVVLCEQNVAEEGKVIYLPIYMVAFLGE